MSPLLLRRYRADRLLREQFEQLRRSVVGSTSARLRTVGIEPDAGDLEACYAQAWQGLYCSLLDGEQIDDPRAWLVLVTYRRALDEHRARISIKRTPIDSPRADRAAPLGAGDRDLAEQLDDRVQLRHLFEALRARLNAREQQAATLCYLQGLTRDEAATRMGVSAKRMRKLMEGNGENAPGVAGKVGALVATIGAGRWCDEQGSLMRGFAYGILDPAGERYALAELHHGECSACRAYVLLLRGLAAALPPIPGALLLLGSGAAGGAAGSSAAGGLAPGGSALGTGALSASGAAGAGAAGGGWWLAGPLGAKLAAGCVLALGLGAGCVALGGRSDRGGVARHRHGYAATQLSHGVAGRQAIAPATVDAANDDLTHAVGMAAAPDKSAAVAPAAQAAREFGPEQPAMSSAAVRSTSRPVARAAVSSRASSEPAQSNSAAPSAGAWQRPASGGVPAAEREFAPG